MSGLLPTSLLRFAGVAAMVPWASLPHRPVSLRRLIAEAFAVTLAVIGAFWLGWIDLWLVEQRW
jgi:hypothetical protein